MKWFTYSISSLATAAVATVAVVIGSTIYTLFSLGENSSMGEAFFGTIRLRSEAVPDGGVRMQMSMVNPAPVVVTLILLTLFIFAVVVAYNRPSARRAQSEK
ncbi:hypothetical protein [Rothia mucilaginosa]|uniref:hypothetical protein n=1 Tax=Rothia mucilaginosa TaxID=43675 RepID=UPI0028DB26D2|nr:hypothetical protein [Rothia mucilaginosa]